MKPQQGGNFRDVHANDLLSTWPQRRGDCKHDTKLMIQSRISAFMKAQEMSRELLQPVWKAVHWQSFIPHHYSESDWLYFTDSDIIPGLNEDKAKHFVCFFLIPRLSLSAFPWSFTLKVI